MPNQYTGAIPAVAGENFGRLTVISDDPRRVIGKPSRWIFRCDCGTVKSLPASKARRGEVRSCGCLRDQTAGDRTRTHGMTERVPEYNIWLGMRKRCLNKNCRAYPYYGGRGITICPEWSDFAVFYTDMGSRPTPQHTIDRIDNDRGYEPKNCRWVTQADQCRNRRFVRKFTVGDSTLTLSQWAEKLGTTANTLDSRLHRGWTPERAMTQSVRRMKPWR